MLMDSWVVSIFRVVATQNTQFSSRSRSPLLPIASLTSAISFLLLANSTPAIAQTETPVVFDTPAIIVAEPINPAVVELPTMGGDLYRVRIPVSVRINPNFQPTIDEFSVEVASPQHTMRVIDFWPRDATFSEIKGNVAVEEQTDNNRRLTFKVSGGYEPFVRGSADGQLSSNSQKQQRYERRPPMQLLTTSGTASRGFGAFFKFRPGPVPAVEGTREIALLVEVPHGWRGDLMRVDMHAVDTDQSKHQRFLGTTRLSMAIHREGDQLAAKTARHFAREEQYLRALAVSNEEQIRKKSLPTIWHKMGAALDIVEPRIPPDYLSRVLFGPADPDFDRRTSRLPVDLRVAILDYWDQRQALQQLANPLQLNHQLSANW